MQAFSRHILFLSLLTGTVVILSACNGSGSSLSGGRQCPASYTPIPMELPAQQKLSLKFEEQKNITPGIYTYQTANVYYVAGPGPSDLRIQVNELKQSDGSFKAVVGCMRNAQPHMKDFSLEIPGVTVMDVDNNFKTTINTQNFGFKITNTLVQPTDTAGKDKVVQSPSEVYDSTKGATAFLIKHTDVSYELRASGPTPDGGTYYLSIIYTIAPY